MRSIISAAPLRRITQSRVQATVSSHRLLHASAVPHAPYKNTQDRESLDPRPRENTQSGRDDDVASNPEAAFDPRKTRPESEYGAAGKSADDASNPLNASGANQELSKPLGDETSSKGTGQGTETQKGGASRKQSAPKEG